MPSNRYLDEYTGTYIVLILLSVCLYINIVLVCETDLSFQTLKFSYILKERFHHSKFLKIILNKTESLPNEWKHVCPSFIGYGIAVCIGALITVISVTD